MKLGSPNLQACLFTEQTPSPKSPHSWLCNPKDCSPPGSSAHGILQARILKRIAVPSSRAPSGPRDRTQVSSALAGRFFTTSATWKAPALQPTYWISSERRSICIVNKTPGWFWGSPESQNHCTCLSGTVVITDVWDSWWFLFSSLCIFYNLHVWKLKEIWPECLTWASYGTSVQWNLTQSMEVLGGNTLMTYWHMKRCYKSTLKPLCQVL